MNSSVLLVILLICTVPCSAFAEIYKCIDNDGNYHFTDDATNLPKECSQQPALQAEVHTDSPDANKPDASNPVQDALVGKWKKLLPGKWELRNDKQQFAVVWEILEDGTCTLTITGIGQSGVFTQSGYGKCEISNGKLVSTYTKGQILNHNDNIIQLDESTLDLGGDRKFIRKK